MTLHIADYEIVLAPAGMVVLVFLIALAVLGAVTLVRILRRKFTK